MRRESVCQKRRLTVDNQFCQKRIAKIWQTPLCAKKVEVVGISPVHSMIPASIRRQRECGAASHAKNVHVTFRGMKGSPPSLLALPCKEQIMITKQPACAGCFIYLTQKSSPSGNYAVVSSVSLVVTAFVVSAGIGASACVAVVFLRPFLGGSLTSAINSIMHMGEASPRRNPTLTIRV
jgi:hypothetical protein